MEIEIDSAYRNRTLYDNPFNFEILVNTPNKGFFEALDPVSLAAPQCYFTGNTLDSVNPNVTLITGVVNRIIPDSVEVLFTNNIFEKTNYYRGLTTDFNGLIIKYEYVGTIGPNFIGRFYIDPFPHTLLLGQPFNLYYWPNIQPLNSLNTTVKMFVPAKPFCGTFAILYNETRHNYNPIVYSDNVSVTVKLEQINWQYNDTFSLRDDIPTSISTVLTNTNNTITVNTTDSGQNDFVFVPSIEYYGKITNKFANIFTVTPTINVVIIPGSEIQYLPFSYDNVHSLPYIGTSDQQQRTWVIELISVQIPNAPLKNKFNLMQFSHLYVEFRDPFASPQNNIMSNNPNSNNSYFRVVPSKLQPQKEWISFDCDGSRKTIRFTPTSMQFRFKIIEPTGKILKFKQKDTHWPVKPEAGLQVNALFNVKIL